MIGNGRHRVLPGGREPGAHGPRAPQPGPAAARVALNLLRQDTTVKAGVAIRHRKAGRNLACMEQVLGLVNLAIALPIGPGSGHTPIIL